MAISYLATGLQADPLQRRPSYSINGGQKVLEQRDVQISKLLEIIHMNIRRKVRMSNVSAKGPHLCDDGIDWSKKIDLHELHSGVLPVPFDRTSGRDDYT